MAYDRRIDRDIDICDSDTCSEGCAKVQKMRVAKMRGVYKSYTSVQMNSPSVNCRKMSILTNDLVEPQLAELRKASEMCVRSVVRGNNGITIRRLSEVV